jgi:peptide/nickel transport system permease protein
LFWFGYRTPMAGASLFTSPWDNLQIVIGPAVVLGLGQTAYRADGALRPPRVVREDYVRTARARGLPGRLVISMHALPNAAAGDYPVGHSHRVHVGRVDPDRAGLRDAGLGFAMYIAVYERDVS